MKYKDFNEAALSGETFCQVMYYDRREEYSGNRKSANFKTDKAAEEFIAKMREENEALFQKMLKLYSEYGVTEENYKDNYLWNSMNNKVDFHNLTNQERMLYRYDEDAVGYCFISKFARNLKDEERKEQEQYESMTEEEIEEMEQSQGPYGGAFADWDDFYNWKEN